MRIIALMVLVTALVVSCKHKDKYAGPTIFTGKTIDLANETIGKDGGEIFIDKPGDSLDGLGLEVPAGSFHSACNFKISSSTITKHDLGPNFNPVTPLITISNGGIESDSAIILDIPINIPDEKFAMAFLYDDHTGEIEGLPLLESGSDRVVVAVTNFSHSMVNLQNIKAAQAGGGVQGAAIQVVVTAIDRSKLSNVSDSKFRPGIDDMPCVNVGSSFAPNGFCDGQSQAMLWYFDNKRLKGEKPLFQLLDNNGDNPTPSFGFDDVKAMKFSSVLQGETRTKPIPFFPLLVWANRDMGPILGDEITLNAFAYSILLTKEPQYIAMFPALGPGHAMVVYKVVGNDIYVADPNHPGDSTKKIPYDASTGKIGPLFGSLKADAPTFPFTNFYYVGKSALLPYSNASQFWQQVENGSIGKLKFPEMIPEVINDNGEWERLPDNYHVPDGKTYIVYRVRTPGMITYCDLFDAEGNKIPGSVGTIQFGEPGVHKIGFCVKDSITNRWAGFKWIIIKADKGEKVDKDSEWKSTTTVEPPYGQMAMTIIMNGESITYDTCRFDIEQGSFRLQGPYVNIWRDRFEINCNDFHGEGEYKIEGDWVSNTHYPVGSFYGEGTMKVTKWRDGRLEGSFSFNGKDSYPTAGEPTVTVTGDFNYKVPWVK